MTSVEIARQLIQFDTTSGKSNLALIEFVANYLDGFRIRSALTFDTGRRKANLLASIGPEAEAGVVLSGHTDVVPVADQRWSVDPFEAVVSDDKLFGRGACDMKGFIAVVLAAVPYLSTLRLRWPIHIALSYDEEVGCIGARQLVAQIAALPMKPVACFIGEPTNMGVAVKHKGKKWLRCRVHGKAGHSSAPLKGVNAVEAAAELIVHLKELASRLRAAGPLDADLDPPYTTVHTGIIAGGTAYNVIPAECAFDFEIRHLPRDDPSALVREIEHFANEKIVEPMRGVDGGTGVTLELVSEYPGLAVPEDHGAVRLAQSLLGHARLVRIGFSTEGGLFQAAGIPAVICGPGSIAQAHQGDEFVTLAQLTACEAFLQALADRAAADSLGALFDTKRSVPIDSTRQQVRPPGA